MTKVFIGGSRNIGRLDADVLGRLDRIIEKRFPVLVGDANGADKAVQQHLHKRGYDSVEVFCAGDECRNNIGRWPLRMISTDGRRKDFSFYATKDRVMAEEASIGLMIWDGKSIGTLLNVSRLVRAGKKVVVYLANSKNFETVKSETDLERFSTRCPPDLRRRLEREAAAEVHSEHAPRHPTLL